MAGWRSASGPMASSAYSDANCDASEPNSFSTDNAPASSSPRAALDSAIEPSRRSAWLSITSLA